MSRAVLWDGSQYRGLANPAPVSYDWSEANPPWAYTGTTQVEREAEFLANYPPGWTLPTIVDLAGSGTFRQRVLATIAANGRCAIRLPAGVHHLTSFEAASGPMYAFGLWHTDLVGFIGAGPDQTVIQMDADSLSQTQLDGIAAMTLANWDVLQIGMMRLDGDPASPVVLAGLTIRADDQQLIPAFGADIGIAGNQPAPHKGVEFYKLGSSSISAFYQSHVRYQGAARACNSRPPFESANWGSGEGYGYSYHVESDGRRAPELDPARPRRCGVMMGNSEYVSVLSHCWLHHTNLSRYAVNDQNRPIDGEYLVAYCKAEQITNTRNVDPALNGGNSLGGWTNATPFGWESTAATVTVHDTIISQDNNNISGQFPADFQMTHVGSRNPQGGRFFAWGNDYRCSPWPQLDGFACFRILNSTYWWTDGLATTLDVRKTAGGPKLTPHVYTGTWPPSAAYLAANSLTPDTHCIVKAA